MKKCSSIKPSGLSPKQRNILTEFMDNLGLVEDYDGYTFEEIERFKKEDPEINEIFVDYQKALFKAIRADLHTHPLVPTEIKAVLTEWVQTHRGLGDKVILRKAKRGLEVGVSRPLTKAKAELIIAIEEFLFRAKEFETPPKEDDNDVANDVATIGEILHKIRLTSIYDPDNPPPKSKKPRSWSQIHRSLVQRGTVKMTRQGFLKKIERLSPTLFPKPKITT